MAALSFNAGYPLMDSKVATPTIIIGYAHYKLSSDDQMTDAISAAIGAVYRPVPVFSLDVQAQWIQNKIYCNDARFFCGLVIT